MQSLERSGIRLGRRILQQRAQYRRPISYYNKPSTSLSFDSLNPLASSSFTVQLKRLPSIASPVIFAVGTGSLAFVLAAVLTNNDTEQRVSAVVSRNRWSRSISSADLAKERLKASVKRAQRTLGLMKEYGANMRISLLLMEGWINLSESQRSCGILVAINTAVFTAWQIRKFSPFMVRTFLHDPLGNRSRTLLGAVFSHKSFLHFSLNSIALYSIGSAAHQWLARPSRLSDGGALQLRSTSRYEFFAFFIGAGLFASLASHLYATRILLRRAMRSATSVPAILPSLGASGAIYGCLSITTFAYSGASVSLIFLPFFPIPITFAYWSMITLDLVGLLRGWRLFDHAAHLGGAFFGLLYFWKGAELFEEMRIWLRELTGGGGRAATQTKAT